MSNPINPNLTEQLQKLQQKYEVMGQDLSSYLDGLLYADYLTYWDYIHLDTLLSLQTPKTHFPDEKVFIMYHQITELYFHLILWEIEQVSENIQPTEKYLCDRMDRINNYFKQLVGSYDVMVTGMEREQFLKFRMSLLPASGFQSGQYRMIELCSTDLINLVNVNDRASMQHVSIDEQLEKLYWRSGATELATGKKTLTLQQFEQKYNSRFKQLAVKFADKNLKKIYTKFFPTSDDVKKRLREFDELANVRWPLSHYKSAAKYLHKSPEDIKATGGTNWQKYLPPRFQKIIFFPELWSEQEKEEWGKAGLMS
ncbi:MAG: tryptophan 2,3-dioxygenase [Bacteroidetes bacterium]|nr:tryptophan 2,3-dioxygenase [Bacteroidota bacterium]